MLGFSVFLIPLIILLAVIVFFLLLIILGRVAGGRPLRAVMKVLMKVPILGNALQKMSQAALERQNPELASAVKKLDRMNAASGDPQRAQRALNQLTPEERRAYMAAVEEQGAMPEPANRAMRRQMAKQKKRR